MEHIIIHDTKDYLKGVKLWFYRLFIRIIKSRKSLTIQILLIFGILFVFNKWSATGFAFFVFLVLVIDLVIFVKATFSQIKRTETIIINRQNIIIKADEYFCYLYDHDEFLVTEWDDIDEIYRLNNPKLFSFKDRKSKHVFVIYESELGEINYHILLNKIEEKAKA